MATSRNRRHDYPPELIQELARKIARREARRAIAQIGAPDSIQGQLEGQIGSHLDDANIVWHKQRPVLADIRNLLEDAHITITVTFPD